MELSVANNVKIPWFVDAVVALFILKYIDQIFLNKTIQFNFKIFLFYFLVSFTAIFVIPLFFLFNRGDCVNSQRVSNLLRLYSYPLGVQWEVRGKENMADPRGCIVVVNHQNSLDILGLFWIWRYFDRMAAVAKKEIFYVWPFGLSAYLAGVVFIDRQKKDVAKKELENAAKEMHSKGTKLLLFPEGTRNTKRQTGQFKKGAFHIAVSCQVPIMPIVISPYFFINPDKRFFGSGRVIIEALPPISTSGLTSSDVDDLTRRVRDVMAERYNQMADELRASLPSDYPGL